MAFVPVKRLTLELDGTHLDCVRFGTGDRPLVIVPGLSLQGVRGAALPLALSYRIFSKTHTVYVFDKKAAVPEGYAIRDLAGDLAAAMDRLGLAHADVFGVSQGGMIAQRLAIERPELVRRLVLGVTASRTNPVMEEAVGGWIGMARRGDYRALILDMFPRMYSEGYLKRYQPLFPLLTRVGKPRDFGRFIALARACLTCDTYEELHKIACPVLVLGASEDRVVTGAASEEIAARLSCALHMYQGLGHAAYEEAPDFNRRVLRFLCDSAS